MMLVGRLSVFESPLLQSAGCYPCEDLCWMVRQTRWFPLYFCFLSPYYIIFILSSVCSQHPKEHFPMNIELKNHHFVLIFRTKKWKKVGTSGAFGPTCNHGLRVSPVTPPNISGDAWTPGTLPAHPARGTFKRRVMHQVLEVEEAKCWFLLKHEKVTPPLCCVAGHEGDKSCCWTERQWCWSWGERGSGIEKRGADSEFQLSAEPTGWKVHLSAAILSVCLSLSLSITVSPPSPPPVTIIPIFSHFLCPPSTTLPPSFCIYCRIYFCWKVSLVHLLVS